MRSFGRHRSDNKTARERITGNGTVPYLAYFGECVHYKPAKTILLPKDEVRWKDGLFLGFIDGTTEYVIGTNRGSIKCRAIRHKDPTEQFNIESPNAMHGTPWMPVPSRESMRIPTNIEDSGEILDGNGNVEGHAEETENISERFEVAIDSTQDDSKEHENEGYKSKFK